MADNRAGGNLEGDFLAGDTQEVGSLEGAARDAHQAIGSGDRRLPVGVGLVGAAQAVVYLDVRLATGLDAHPLLAVVGRVGESLVGRREQDSGEFAACLVGSARNRAPHRRQQDAWRGDPNLGSFAIVLVRVERWRAGRYQALKSLDSVIVLAVDRAVALSLAYLQKAYCRKGVVRSAI